MVIVINFNSINKNYSITYLFREEQDRKSANKNQRGDKSNKIIQWGWKLAYKMLDCPLKLIYNDHLPKYTITSQKILILHQIPLYLYNRLATFTGLYQQDQQGLRYMNPVSSKSHDQVFVEENRQEDIAKMHKLLAMGNASNIQNYFYNQAKLNSGQLHKVADAQINRHLSGLNHRNKGTLKTLLRKAEEEGFNWHQLKAIHQQKTTFSSNEEDYEIQKYLSFMDDVYIGQAYKPK